MNSCISPQFVVSLGRLAARCRFPEAHGILTFLIIAGLLTGAAGCAGKRRVPDLQRIFAAARTSKTKRPLIIIPGILGSELVNRETGEVVFPKITRSDADDLRLPFASTDLTKNRDALVPRNIVSEIKIAALLPSVEVYRQSIETLKQHGGYREGDWENPGETGDRDTFYVFAYDWRRDNVESAQELIRQVERLKTKLGKPDLKFNVLGHSMGGLIARYAAMYGAGDLPPEETAAPPEPTWAGARHFSKIFLIGTPNEGSMVAFDTLLNGYSLTSDGRARLPGKLKKSDAFTIPALYQIMPFSHTERFYNENFEELSIDLYNVENWKKYKWSSLYDAKFLACLSDGEEYRRQIETSRKGKRKNRANKIYDGETLTSADVQILRESNSAQARAFLETVLNRARRFQQALNAPSDAALAPVRILIFGGDCEQTLGGAVLHRNPFNDEWHTVTRPRAFAKSNGAKVKASVAAEKLLEPGDGTVTRRSLLAETLAAARGVSDGNQLFETAVSATSAVFFCEQHAALLNNPTIQNNFLTTIVSEAVR